MSNSSAISSWLVLGPIFNKDHQKPNESDHHPGDGGPLVDDIIMDIDANELKPTQVTEFETAPHPGDTASYGGKHFPSQSYTWQVLSFRDVDWGNIDQIDDNIHRRLGTDVLPKDTQDPRSFAGKHHSLAFFLVYIDSPDARKSKLCVRSDDAIRVWLNGREISALRWARPRNAKTDPETCADLPLDQGPNVLLAAVAEYHTEWALSARIENAAGLRISARKPCYTSYDEQLPLPVEIPWKRAGTSQLQKQDTTGIGDPYSTTITIFYYEPKTANVDSDYPDERLVYLKACVSISPARVSQFPDDILKTIKLIPYLNDTAPVWQVKLDLKVIPIPLESPLPQFGPYFHAASPLRRTMVETGIVGNDLFEGTADSLSVGKSASQLHESASSSSKTSGGEVGGSFFGYFGAKYSTTGTNVSSDRQVDQKVDTTNRDASKERRELLSHMTNVSNVLTLLDAKHLGSRFLQFTLRPRPLRMLSIDPLDPNHWYQEFLYRRSSGIEGIQEFIAVAAVPKGKDFCIQADLTRICVLDNPPVPPLPWYWSDLFGDKITKYDVLAYLDEMYPMGTPLDDLDVEVKLRNPNLFLRPIVKRWHIFEGMEENIFLIVKSPPANLPDDPNYSNPSETVGYKRFEEVALELKWQKYEKAITSSPLEKGYVVSLLTSITIGFTSEAEGYRSLGVIASDSTGEDKTTLPNKVQLAHSLYASITVERTSSRRGWYLQAVGKWNALDNQLAASLADPKNWSKEPLRPDDPDLIRLLIDAWADLAPDDPHNQSLDEAAPTIGIGDDEKERLKSASVRDLRGLAQAINAAPGIERYNAAIERRKERMLAAAAMRPEAEGVSQFAAVGVEPLAVLVSVEDATRLRQTIGRALSGIGEPGTEPPAASSPKRGKAKKER